MRLAGDRLRRKLLSYARLGRRRDAPEAIVFLFPSELRERHARPKLDIDIGIPVATSAKEIFYSDPLGSVWLPIGRDQRFPLVRLQERATL